jgi:hypothetical protein
VGVDAHEGALQVVEDGEGVHDEGGGGEAAVFVALLVDALLIVLEVGFGALPVAQVLLGVLLRL